MRKQTIVAVLTSGAIAAMICAAPAPLTAQERASLASGWTPPRLPDGTPDLQGLYRPDFRGGAPNNNIEAHPPSFLRNGGKSVVVDPPDGRIPYQPWALKERDWRRRPENSWYDPEGHCFLSGVPRQMYITGGGGVFQVLQTAGSVLFLFEYIHAYRVVRLDPARRHLPGTFQLWQGDSVGWWEGNTLVIETTNNNGKTWFELSGNFMSDAVRHLERLTLVDANTIEYEVTITDPKVYTRPWKMALAWRRVPPGSGDEILEQACHEDERDQEHLRPLGKTRGAGR